LARPADPREEVAVRPLRVAVVCLLAAAMAAVGCTGRSTGPAATPTSTTTTAGAATTTTGAAGTTGPGSATTAPPQWTTAPKARTNHPEVPRRIPMLVAIRTGSHDGYDRVVLQFRNDLPSWEVRYVRRVTSESGATLRLEGEASLFVQVDPAWGHDQDTPPYAPTYTGPRTLIPRYPTLRQVRWVDDFEGHLTFGVGLRGRVGFRVLELREPSRLAIDVAH
jgi:hypothetical protein